MTSNSKSFTNESRSDGKRGGQTSRGTEVNVSQAERMVSGIAGVALTALGARAASAVGVGVAAVGGALIYRGFSGQCSLYRSLGVDTAAASKRGRERGAAPTEYASRGMHIHESIAISRTPWDLYTYWRKFENLPGIMRHLESVEVIDSVRSHWKAKAPAGTTVEWDAEIINDEPNALIAWRSLANASVDNAGSVRFIPGPAGQGTLVNVVLDYIPPGGRVGSWVARLFGEEPALQVRADLLRFKQLMETAVVDPQSAT